MLHPGSRVVEARQAFAFGDHLLTEQIDASLTHLELEI